MSKFTIAPSILSADCAKLGAECDAVIDAGADMIHFDVMDNHYVPNLTLGPLVCSALRKHGIQAPIDVHLMVKPVDTLIEAFANVGASIITIHPEATEHLDRSLQRIRELGCQAGIALNPSTSPDVLDYVLDKIDLVLVRSGNPGFAAQRFIDSAMKKISKVRAMIDNAKLKIKLEVDGGVNIENITSIARAGADTFVAGNAIFSTNDYAETIGAMRDSLSKLS